MPSTVVSRMEYDPESLTLRITFVSGMIYEYKDVPQDEFDKMRTSGAKGIYLNTHIKNKYRFQKLK